MRSMKKTTTIAALIALIALTLGSALTAHAQTTADTTMFINVSGGGQIQSHEFSSTSTFSLFNETGTVNANQTVGNGFVFDAAYGYRVYRRLYVAGGISTFNGNGSAAAVAAVPSPLFIGKPTNKTYEPSDFGDLSQSNIAFNFTAVWIQPVTDKIDVSIFAGPSVIHVNQDIASVTETEAATATAVSESATTGKAGNAGVDLSYKVNDRYSVGAFVRYLGGEAELPSVSTLKIGGTQVGGGIRYRF